MVQPINYTQDVQTPFQAAAQGLTFGAGIQQMQAQQQEQQLKLQAAQAAQEQQQAMRERIQSVMSNPNPTAKDYAQLSMLMPKDQAESTRKAWDMLSADRQKAQLGRAGQVLAAFNSGANDIAQDLLKNEATALRNAGDEEGAKAAEVYAQIAKINPAMARTNIGLLLAGIPGGDKVIEGVTALGAERRADEEAPFNLTKAKAESVIKDFEAKFAPDKIRADLGLVAAQTGAAGAAAESSRASAAASRATAEKAKAEAGQINAGVIPVEKRPEAEQKFRKEYSDQTKGYQEVKSAFGRLKASASPKTKEEEGAADLSLIYSYMKMLDPGSVVREGEFATAETAGGAFNKVGNIYNKVLSGGRLTAAQRQVFVKQAEKLYDSAKEQETTVRQGIGRIAKGYGLNAENIFFEPTESRPGAAPAAQTPDAAPPGAVRRK